VHRHLVTGNGPTIVQQGLANCNKWSITIRPNANSSINHQRATHHIAWHTIPNPVAPMQMSPGIPLNSYVWTSSISTQFGDSVNSNLKAQQYQSTKFLSRIATLSSQHTFGYLGEWLACGLILLLLSIITQTLN